MPLKKTKETTKINQNFQFILAYTHRTRKSKTRKYGIREFFKEPTNSVLILKSSLERGGILPSRIAIIPFEKIFKEREMKKLFFLGGGRKKKTIFLISTHILPSREKIKTTGDYTRFWQRFWQTVAKIKKHSNSLIVVGGPGVTNCPSFFMKDKLVDMIVLGEGETFIPYLLKTLKNKELQPIPGAHILKNGNYIFGGKRKPLSSRGIYEAQRAVIKFLENEPKSAKEQKFIFLEFSRGCLFNCTFCPQTLMKKNLNLESKEWLRMVPPRAAANLIKKVIGSGFEKVWIVDCSLTSSSRRWLKEFLEKIKIITSSAFDNKITFYFYSSPIDFQEGRALNFVKEISRFFQVSIQMGFEALDKETLLKFSKPHKSNCQKLFSKILNDLKPLIEADKVRIIPSFIAIHPWITFKKWRQLIRFAKKFKFEIGGFLSFLAVENPLMIESEETRISGILKNENLSLRAHERFPYKFVYAKKVFSPKDENDTDISRFAHFLASIKNNRLWDSYKNYKTRFLDLLKDVENGEKIRNNVENQLFDFLLEVLNEAEGKWPKLKYEQYRTECQKKLKVMEKIIEDAHNTVSALRRRNEGFCTGP